LEQAPFAGHNTIIEGQHLLPRPVTTCYFRAVQVSAYDSVSLGIVVLPPWLLGHRDIEPFDLLSEQRRQTVDDTLDLILFYFLSTYCPSPKLVSLYCLVISFAGTDEVVGLEQLPQTRVDAGHQDATDLLAYDLTGFLSPQATSHSFTQFVF
jgi:hypothetical protein